MHNEIEEFCERERAAAILPMCTELQWAHKDIQMNLWVCKHCWRIIIAVEERKVNLSLSAMRSCDNGSARSSRLRIQHMLTSTITGMIHILMNQASFHSLLEPIVPSVPCSHL